MYDWCIKSIAIQQYPKYYNQLMSKHINIFDIHGKFQPIDNPDKLLEDRIYSKARDFVFDDPRELFKLMRVEEMLRLKNRKFLNNKDKESECKRKLDQL